MFAPIIDFPSRLSLFLTLSFLGSVVPGIAMISDIPTYS